MVHPIKFSFSLFNKFKSFETMKMVLQSSLYISIFVIYRPLSNDNNSTNKMFFEEFSTVLEQFSTDPISLCLVGDFNFQVEDTSNGVCSSISKHCRIF